MVNVFLGTYSLVNGIYMSGGLNEKAPETLEGKFSMIRELGYDGAELLAQDLLDNTPEQIRSALQNTGMRCRSAHCSLDQMPALIPAFGALGADFLICAGNPMLTREDALAVAGRLNEYGKAAAKYGFKVGYHSHHCEFFVDQGKSLEEYLIENTDPETVVFQLDCGWAAGAGVWAPSFIARYPGRFPAIHVKENSKVLGPDPMPDGAKDPEASAAFLERSHTFFPTQCRLGAPESNLDYRKIYSALLAQNIGEPLLVVEREYTYAGERLDCLREDCAWLKANL